MQTPQVPLMDGEGQPLPCYLLPLSWQVARASLAIAVRFAALLEAIATVSQRSWHR